ncbi:hypothetical protein QI302_02410 [Staphylococcus saprophyticus]|nr:hypothetical protein [Staphylococcus saprophyticus]MDW4219860.1 hypothetical protein [Staphylococcus saprophyticus]MDW4338269.1 hypothetical protein [Staphylococcus saprophyticus]
MNELIREIYGLSKFDAMHDEDEKENAFGYLEESMNDDLRTERNMK